MRIVLVTTGSSGDVRPFVALALGLRQAGHTVRLAASPNAAALADRYGLDFVAIDPSCPAGETLLPSLERGNTLRFGLQRLRRKQRSFFEINLAAWRACQGADGLIYRLGGVLAVDSIAEKLGLPCIKAGLVPYTPTAEFPDLRLFNGRPFGRLGNRLSYLLAEGIVWQFFRPQLNRFRRDALGLPSHPFIGPEPGSFTSRLPLLYAFSPALLPPPADWPGDILVTGAWELPGDPGWQPPPGLTDFLSADPPPVYVGFGSMQSRDPLQTGSLVRQAVRLCGQRAVLATGSAAGPSACPAAAPLNDRVYELAYAPHAWLFPQVAAVVHHGGVGTTTAALKAGRTSVIVPFNYDQPFWGEIVYRRGLGPKPLPRRDLTPGRLARLIELALGDPLMRRNAFETGQKICQEHGVETAVAFIQNYFSQSRV